MLFRFFKFLEISNDFSKKNKQNENLIPSLTLEGDIENKLSESDSELGLKNSKLFRSVLETLICVRKITVPDRIAIKLIKLKIIS